MRKSFVIVIVLTAILALGSGIYFLVKNGSAGEGSKSAGKSLEELKVEALEIDLSLSPLPKLNVSSLNLSSPRLPSSDIFPGFSADTDFSYQGNLDVAAPAIPQLSAPTTPTKASGPTINAATCSQFSAIPSGYCSMAGASGQALCEQCKAGGF